MRHQSRAERVAPLLQLRGDDALLISEIYSSIQGESTWVGVPCTFVRLAVCHLRCAWCDTEHSFSGGDRRTVESVVGQVAALGLPLVEITGGEPLLQPAALPLMRALCNRGHSVLLETSGAVGIGRVDPRVHRIVDVKTPSSGEEGRMLWQNLPLLAQGRDELKFVIADEADYAYARQVLANRPVPAGVVVLFSPAAPSMDPRWLAERIVADRLPVRFQLQLHKVLWRDAPGV